MCRGSSVAAMYSKSASEGSSICGVEQLRSRQAAPLAQTEICAAELEKEEEEEGEGEGEEGKGRQGGKEANNGRAACESWGAGRCLLPQGEGEEINTNSQLRKCS